PSASVPAMAGGGVDAGISPPSAASLPGRRTRLTRCCISAFAPVQAARRRLAVVVAVCAAEAGKAHEADRIGDLGYVAFAFLQQAPRQVHARVADEGAWCHAGDGDQLPVQRRPGHVHGRSHRTDRQVLRVDVVLYPAACAGQEPFRASSVLVTAAGPHADSIRGPAARTGVDCVDTWTILAFHCMPLQPDQSLRRGADASVEAAGHRYDGSTAATS